MTFSLSQEKVSLLIFFVHTYSDALQNIFVANLQTLWLPQKFESPIWIVGKTRKIDLGFGNSTSRVVIALPKATIQETPGALVVACTESRRSTSGELNHLEWNVLRLKRAFLKASARNLCLCEYLKLFSSGERISSYILMKIKGFCFHLDDYMFGWKKPWDDK